MIFCHSISKWLRLFPDVVRSDSQDSDVSALSVPANRTGKFISFSREQVQVGQASYGGGEFGAVRAVSPNGRPELVIYVENAGDFVVPLSAVEAVHSQKVILNCGKLDRRLRQAIGHAHNAEQPNA